MNRFIGIKSKMTLLNYFVATAMLTFAFYAPESFFMENGPIETLEVATLLLASAFCFIEYKKGRRFNHFFLTCGFLLLVFVGRELSWGRVFFTNELGEIPKRRDWVFGPYVYYVLAPALLAIIAHAYKTKFVQNSILLLKKAPIMTFDFILVILMMATSIAAEGHMLPGLDHLSYAIEESAEVALYFTVAIIISSYSRKNLLTKI